MKDRLILSTSSKGVTLVELMLVLAIGISIILLGIRFYAQFQFQANEQKLAANVNQLFQALENFYHANCRLSISDNGNAQSAGKLDPAVIDTAQIATVINLSVTNDLVTTGFIPAAQWHPNNPLVDNNSPPDQGYFVQFNRVLVNGADQPMNVYACTGSTASSSCDVTSGVAISSQTNAPSAQSNSVIWVAQVAVKLANNLTSDQWTQIMNDISAACVSSAAGSGVAPCTPLPAANGYLVWTRHPTFYNPHITSDFWLTEPYVKEFNQQYTNDSMGALSGVTKETKSSTSGNTWYNALHYLCGG